MRPRALLVHGVRADVTIFRAKLDYLNHIFSRLDHLFLQAFDVDSLFNVLSNVQVG
jgi:hypothetical protein